MVHSSSASQQTEAPELADTHAKLWRPSEDDSEEIMQHTNISCLFDDAAAYRDAIDAESSTGQPGRCKRPTVDFAELVGPDLDVAEKVEASKFAQISADDWTTTSDEEEAQIHYTDEPESFTDPEVAEPVEPSEVPIESGVFITEPTQDIPQEDLPPEPSASLTPDQIVSILIQEFGPLAAQGEEEFLFQSDVAVIQDVVILVRPSCRRCLTGD